MTKWGLERIAAVLGFALLVVLLIILSRDVSSLGIEGTVRKRLHAT